MENQIPELETRVVAFVDVLGFSNLVSRIESDDSKHAALFRALSRISSIRETWGFVDPKRNRLKASVFSDSIAISSPVADAASVLLTCGWLQSDLLYLGILLRGGISIGPLVHKDEMVYGNGMIAAYHMESKVAHYPRIVIERGVKDRLPQKLQDKLLLTDSDGVSFIDPFEFNTAADGADDLYADGNDPREIYFLETLSHLEAEEEAACSADTRAKWTWMLNRCRAAAEAYMRNRNQNSA